MKGPLKRFSSLPSLSESISFFTYRSLTSLVAPLAALHVRRRALLGHEVPEKWRQKLGGAMAPRPDGPIIWCHVASVGEGTMLVPIIRKCIEAFPASYVLLTTRDSSALLLSEKLFEGQKVICQFAPIDAASAVASFILHWHPSAAIFVESELWPNLLLSPLPQLTKIPMALLNARMSEASAERWSNSSGQALVAAMLKRFCLISPPDNEQGLRLQLLGAPPSSIRFLGDLKFSMLGGEESSAEKGREEVKKMFGKRKVWLAASTHEGEEEAAATAHVGLKERFPRLLTVITPRHPSRASAICKMLKQKGLVVAQRSKGQAPKSGTDVYLVDTIGELVLFYSCIQVVFVGGSLFPSLSGHNLAEAAAASCAIITGPHVGSFASMLKSFQAHSPLSVWQILDKSELQSAVGELLSNEAKRNARCISARRAATAGNAGVVEAVWKSLVETVFVKAMLNESQEEEKGASEEVDVREDGPDAELSRWLKTRRERIEVLSNGHTKS